MSYKVISTFAGCGGSSLGYKLAGFDELLAIEWESNAVENFKLNFDCPVWQRDIREITGKEILEFCNIKKGELDILDGSPPCQGFSIAGNREMTDTRNDLFFEYIRLVDELQPKVFVCENVKGMMSGNMSRYLKKILKKFISLNYNVSYKLMNAAYYNVPQQRERLIFIGVRKDLNIMPSFPKPNNITNVKDVLPYIDKIGTAPGHKEWISSNKNINRFLIDSDNPNPTIVKSGINKACGYIKIKNEIRKYTINELKKVSSFTDDFKFTGNFNQQWARIGNCVPPNMIKAIAENIKLNILDKLNGNI